MSASDESDVELLLDLTGLPSQSKITEIVTSIAETVGLSRKQVAETFEALSGLIGKNVGKKGPGVFVLPGLMKIMVIEKPATKARKGINPFTKEPTVFKAKPARKVLKIRAVKAAKDALL